MKPGIVLTREDLMNSFNFTNPTSADHLLTLIERADNPYMRVVNINGENLLVFEEDYWETFLQFMGQMGYTHDL